ncbi:MAG: S9 family peptidase, partial [Ferruginibacter sp.]
MRKILILPFVFVLIVCQAQKLEKLTVEKIMRDQKWIGTSPRNPSWSADGRYLFFLWNPEKAPADSVYYISPNDVTPRKSTYAFRNDHPTADISEYNMARTAIVYALDGDLYFREFKKSTTRRITQTVETESNPRFILDDSKIAYLKNQNLFSWDIANGTTAQLTNFKNGNVQKETV